ncbi:hypothetical protein [Actinomadura rupiterrae]|uniref:hypothetical protein n=1 Tax=Actinomadura rupiterrae TaxID=559627 RepID=UPI0020A2F30E|nr:hypothetical protein [Actinomadura rupiterrae]MCP2342900.1 hypothetical protein [Actinomadura rupiterrae]
MRPRHLAQRPFITARPRAGAWNAAHRPAAYGTRLFHPAIHPAILSAVYAAIRTAVYDDASTIDVHPADYATVEPATVLALAAALVPLDE